MGTEIKTFKKNAEVRARNCVLAVDPGVTGGIAVYDYDADKLVAAWDIPITVTTKGRSSSKKVNASSLARDILNAVAEYDVAAVAIEHVHSSPQMGVVSAFNFGDTFGVIRTVAELASTNVLFITPSKWKSRMLATGDKKVAMARARELFGTSPWLMKNSKHGIADAALIAYYAAHNLVEWEVDPFS